MERGDELNESGLHSMIVEGAQKAQNHSPPLLFSFERIVVRRGMSLMLLLMALSLVLCVCVVYVCCTSLASDEGNGYESLIGHK